MIRNYLLIAWRNMLAKKSFTVINVFGLSVALTCCLFMVLYLQDELSFDRFNPKGERIVRVIMEYAVNGVHGRKGNFTSAKVFPAFKENFPEVEDGVRLSPTQRLVKLDNQIYSEDNFLFADSTFFNLFGFKLLQGHPDEVLKAPNSLVLTRAMAKKYFQENDPVGKTLLIGSGQAPFTVTGVCENLPENSQITFDFLASISSFGGLPVTTYFNANYTTYLLLRNKESIASLQKKLPEFMRKELSEMEGVHIDYELEPFRSIHLHSPYAALTPNNNIKYIYIIGSMALLMLIIACFTYINLGTARSIERAREVGVRKVTGAQRGQLFWQFISESGLITFVAIFISFGLGALFLPYFNQLAGKQLTLDAFGQPQIIITAVNLLIVIALFAGSYPALVISNYQPIKVLKGAFKNSKDGRLLRQSLIVFQFMISVGLIIATIVVKRQLDYLQSKSLGYSRDYTLILNADGKMLEKMELIKSELSTVPEVLSVSNSHETPVAIRGGYSMSGTDLSKEIPVTANPIDEHYLPTLDIQLVAGENIDRQDVVEASKQNYEENYYHFLLNVSAANALGWTPDEAIGKKMYLDESRPGVVKGVVQDFHFASLHSPIGPLVLFPGSYNFTLMVKTSGKNHEAMLTSLESKWKSLIPHRPFEFTYLDEDYRALYKTEQRTSALFNVFAFIALALACLGLFGLSAYTARQRIKEISIRKVLGASIKNISWSLSNGFIKMILLAFVMASPLAWWGMQKWLQNFAYRIDLNVWVFVGAGGLALLISILTISTQTLKAAYANPVKNLRSE